MATIESTFSKYEMFPKTEASDLKTTSDKLENVFNESSCTEILRTTTNEESPYRPDSVNEKGDGSQDCGDKNYSEELCLHKACVTNSVVDSCMIGNMNSQEGKLYLDGNKEDMDSDCCGNEEDRPSSKKTVDLSKLDRTSESFRKDDSSSKGVGSDTETDASGKRQINSPKMDRITNALLEKDDRWSRRDDIDADDCGTGERLFLDDSSNETLLVESPNPVESNNINSQSDSSDAELNFCSKKLRPSPKKTVPIVESSLQKLNESDAIVDSKQTVLVDSPELDPIKPERFSTIEDDDRIDESYDAKTLLEDTCCSKDENEVICLKHPTQEGKGYEDVDVKVEEGVDRDRRKSWEGETSDGKTLYLKNLSVSTSRKQLEAAVGKIFGPVKYVHLVKDWQTGCSRGVAFVQFYDVQDAEKCVKQGRMVLHGREVFVRPALTREQMKVYREQKQSTTVGHPTRQWSADNRNLYLASEGYVDPESEAAQDVSKEDLIKRLKRELSKNRLLEDESYFVSPTRMFVDNLPPSLYDSELEQLFRRSVDDRRAEIVEASINRDRDRKSLGCGYVSFGRHEHALAALRNLNNNPLIFSTQRRPIVYFSVERHEFSNPTFQNFEDVHKTLPTRNAEFRPVRGGRGTSKNKRRISIPAPTSKPVHIYFTKDGAEQQHFPHSIPTHQEKKQSKPVHIYFNDDYDEPQRNSEVCSVFEKKEEYLQPSFPTVQLQKEKISSKDADQSYEGTGKQKKLNDGEIESPQTLEVGSNASEKGDFFSTEFRDEMTAEDKITSDPVMEKKRKGGAKNGKRKRLPATPWVLESSSKRNKKKHQFSPASSSSLVENEDGFGGEKTQLYLVHNRERSTVVVREVRPEEEMRTPSRSGQYDSSRRRSKTPEETGQYHVLVKKYRSPVHSWKHV